MMTSWRFIQPVDSLTLRGNKLFGAAGDFGASIFPPRPSVLAGALRSLLLVQAADALEGFSQGQRLVDTQLDRILGTAHDPGDFAVQGIFTACRYSDGRVRIFTPLPADVLAFDQGRDVRYLTPQTLPEGVQAGTPPGLPKVAVLRKSDAAKPEGGWLLTQEGIAAYLAGQKVEPQHLLKLSEHWAHETRVGIGLSRASRTAEDGKLFAVQHSVPRQPELDGYAAGLAVAVSGVGDRLPETGLLRLGGDGRAATLAEMQAPPLQTPIEQIRQSRRFKLVLTSPGLFPAGWTPPHLPTGLRARLVCAAVPRFDVVTGWDLAHRTPKVAQRAAPAGSVYWYEDLDGEPDKLAEWVAGGLWGENVDKPRRAEGYNSAWLAAWPLN